MKIHGLEKLSLVDFNNLTCATVFTGHCNFRCPFCHNAALVLDPASQPLLDEDEVLAYLKKRQGLLDGVCITGGEPTLDRGLADFIDRVKALGYRVKLDTNGTRPDVLRELVESKRVDYVAMDVKNSLAKYGVTAGVADTAAVEQSIAYLLTDPVEYEFRTTLVNEFHTEADIVDIAKTIAGADAYYLQHFVDSGELIDGCGLSEIPKKRAEEYAERASLYVPTQVRGH